MILNYVHDPMCSWCWAFRPVLNELKERLPGNVTWQNVLGGLAADSSVPMPQATRDMVMSNWQRIQKELGTEFNFDFWTLCEPRRSTYISCRAALAAAEQDMEEQMILAIQKAYYLRAMNPSDEETLVTLAAELKMNVQVFRKSLLSAETEKELQTQISTARSWPISGFPSLILKSGEAFKALPLDYRSADTTLDAIRNS